MTPKPDDFEQQLGRCPLRATPPSLQASILDSLRATRARTELRATVQRSAPGGWEMFHSWFTGLSPAWRGLAAVWVVGLSLNALSRDTTERGSLVASARSLPPEQLAQVRAERQELMILAGLREPERPAIEAQPVAPAPPRPRSSLRMLDRPRLG